MKPYIYHTILLCFLSYITTAQTTISGKIVDTKGKPIEAASISIKDSYDGTTSKKDGSYSFKTTEKGKQILEVKYVGYKYIAQAIDIQLPTYQFNFVLKEELSELKAVTVTAGSFEAGDKKRAATVLSSLDVVTTAGSNGDITSAIKTLPGAQQIGDQEGLFVRGGAGYETKQFIDGSMVNNPFFSSVPDLAQRGRFSPFLFKGTVFSTGGYSALYGQALSSALILESIELPQRSEIDISASPLFVGAGTQQVNKNKTYSYGVNYGYTNVGIYFDIVKQRPDYFDVPQFHTGEANFRIKTKKGFLKFYSSFSHNSLGLRRPNIDSMGLKNAFGLRSNNWYNNMSYKGNLSHGWKIQLSASYSTNGDNIQGQIQNQQNQYTSTGLFYIDNNNFTVSQKQDLSQAKVVLEKKLPGISQLRFGAEHWYAYNRALYNQTNLHLLEDHLTAGFAETDIYLTNQLAAKTGVRYEYSSLLGISNWAPRLSLAYKAGKNAQMSLAYGQFYQKPENSWLLFNRALNYTKATHYIANYIKSSSTQTFRIEAYYKDYAQLVKSFPTYNNTGFGHAQGIEIFWRDKKTIKDVDYWFSYSYLDTKRNFLNFPEAIQPNFAANHTASLVVKKFVTKIKTGFNFTYSFATGRPYYDIAYNSTKNTYEIRQQGETTPYHSLNISVNYLPNLGKQNAKIFIVWVASVNNVLNYNQVFGYNFSYNGLQKAPINPAANQFFFIGCFISLGVDRTQDAINNNL